MKKYSNKIIALIVLVFLFGLLLILLPKQDYTKEQAIVIVKNLPEVKQFLSYPNTDTSEGFINAEKNDDSSWMVQVGSANRLKKTDNTGWTATFNWYKVDKNTGKIKCSMSIFDKNGKFIKSGETKEICI